jgi:shikimate dehydrogenase
MKRVALLGSPVRHSVSPAMHNAAFAALRMPWGYSAIEVRPGELAEWVDRLRAFDWAGANITIPHKVASVELVDALSESARRIGAINTIVTEEGRLIGHNTDADGFAADLAAHRVNVTRGVAVVLGAGGAARAVTGALQTMGAEVRLVCRNQEAGRAMLWTLSGADHEERVFSWSPEGFRGATEGAALVVNATPVGMATDADHDPWPADLPLPAGAFVYDLVFNPRETRLVGRAREAGLDACGGLGMLVGQGALAFQLWTGVRPPREVMTSAAKAALEKQDAQVSYSG